MIQQKLPQEGTLIDKIQRRRLRWFGYVARMEDYRLPDSALYTSVDRTRSRGKRCKIWIDNIKHDLKKEDLDMRSPFNLTKDTTQWRHLVDNSPSALRTEEETI